MSGIFIFIKDGRVAIKFSDDPAMMDKAKTSGYQEINITREATVIAPPPSQSSTKTESSSKKIETVTAPNVASYPAPGKCRIAGCDKNIFKKYVCAGHWKPFTPRCGVILNRKSQFGKKGEPCPRHQARSGGMCAYHKMRKASIPTQSLPA